MKHRRAKLGRRCHCEQLEPRRLLTITVNTITDELDGSVADGDLSLPDAVAATEPGETFDHAQSQDGKIVLRSTGERLIPKALSLGASGLVNGLTVTASGNDPMPASTLDDKNNANVSVGRYVDVIVVMDESGSMTVEQAFIGAFIQTLDRVLVGKDFGVGTEPNQYGLVGFAGGGTGNLGHSLLVGEELFGTAEEFSSAATQLLLTGYDEDGYAGIDYALQNYPLRQGAEKIIILVTDEDRDKLIDSLSFNSTQMALADADVHLVSILNVDLRDANNTPTLAVYKRSTAYTEQLNGGFLKSSKGRAVSGNAMTIADYVDLTFDNGGLVADLNQLRQGGNTAESFSNALLDAILTVVDPPRSLIPTVPSTAGPTPTIIVRPGITTAALTGSLLLLNLREAPAASIAAGDYGSNGYVPELPLKPAPRETDGLGNPVAVDVVMSNADHREELILASFLDFVDPELVVIDLGDEPPAKLAPDGPRLKIAHDPSPEYRETQHSTGEGESVTYLKPQIAEAPQAATKRIAEATAPASVQLKTGLALSSGILIIAMAWVRRRLRRRSIGR